MRLLATAIALALTPTAAQAEECKLTPKQVVSNFMDEFYIQKKVRSSFERWVDPGYIQHNPYAATGREAAIGFLEKFVEQNPGQRTTIHRIIGDSNLVAVHSHGWMENGDAAAKRGFAVVDIFRVEGCRVMEHWDVLSPVPETAANTNTMF
ncbi:nuclear transport factor 2 family protein [Novosphingobium taihuense]|uniref:Putative SnoaL-like aldol condensation-catalyzing enzyme n=1 Tax=Novosphingobium taihuense TaxID=260085 RepID=A0A7W7ESB6_9SPHN|nr:nuclear transport factor 2 family protein [Novosphingobium taihuense]MBB4612032.1 putative SnoaL-like aldol condensation-catalyzing enzyme [Novosphingobium taihuense]TWH88615.1 putative SnoaL-like aldol condensation-catalyzing enzyme [Novosphingobium taihuense]